MALGNYIFKKYLIFILTIVITFCGIILISCGKGKINPVPYESIKIDKTYNFDTLITIAQVENFVNSFDTTYRDFHIYDTVGILKTIERCNFLPDTLQFKPFTKADFDNNGFTDILITSFHLVSYETICWMNKGNKLERIRLSGGCEIPIVNNNEKIPQIDLYYFDENANSKIIKKSLIFKYNNFIEKNESTNSRNIEKIEFTYKSPYSFQNNYIVGLFKDTICRINFINCFRTRHICKTGIYKSNTDLANYNEIISLLNYIDFVNLENIYGNKSREPYYCRLLITYDDCNTKVIDDYSMGGTFGLNTLYDLLNQLVYMQEWE